MSDFSSLEIILRSLLSLTELLLQQNPGGSMKSFRNFLSTCRKSRLGWIRKTTGSERPPLQDEERSVNDLHLCPGSLCFNFVISPEQIRSETWFVASEETHLAWTGRPKCNSLSYWSPGTAFCLSTLNFSDTWRFTLSDSYEKLCPVPGCFWDNAHDYHCWRLPNFFSPHWLLFLEWEIHILDKVPRM